jgi:hypothetical protein
MRRSTARIPSGIDSLLSCRLAVRAVHAQTNAGILGTATDNSGAAIPGATVTTKIRIEDLTSEATVRSPRILTPIRWVNTDK